MCYLGDTSKEIFQSEQWERIVQYKNIIIERSFIRDSEIEQGNKTFQIH